MLVLQCRKIRDCTRKSIRSLGLHLLSSAFALWDGFGLGLDRVWPWPHWSFGLDLECSCPVDIDKSYSPTDTSYLHQEGGRYERVYQFVRLSVCRMDNSKGYERILKKKWKGFVMAQGGTSLFYGTLYNKSWTNRSEWNKLIMMMMMMMMSTGVTAVELVAAVKTVVASVASVTGVDTGSVFTRELRRWTPATCSSSSSAPTTQCRLCIQLRSLQLYRP